MSRPAESEEYHRVRGTRPTRAAAEQPSLHTGGRPTRPSGLSPVGKKEWNRIIRILAERGTLTRGDGPAVELYVQQYVLWRANLAEIAAHGMYSDSEWTDDAGKHTKRVLSDAAKQSPQLANSLRAMLIQLGATPTAREKALPTKPDPKKAAPPVEGSDAWYAREVAEGRIVPDAPAEPAREPIFAPGEVDALLGEGKI
jgi:P27 family predicted phage terminase small subunit